MAVEPYSPCPCGSGQKFKWCCHKVEAFADKAQRLYEGGQTEQAIATLDEGLQKEKGNAWLLTRKALIQTRLGRIDDAKATLGRVLAARPQHLGALILMSRLVLESEGPGPGAAQLQQALTAFPPSGRKSLVGLIKVVGAFLSEAGDFPAALKHLALAQTFEGDETDTAITSTRRIIESNPAVPPWLKNGDKLSPPPEALSGDVKGRFEEALRWADEGLWSSAASAFETLSDDRVAGPAATRNLGFCRLWLADDAGAHSALKRYAAGLGQTTEAVDIEALCQQIAPESSDDLVEHVQLIWPLRDRQKLIDALKADPKVHDEGTGPIDPSDENSPEAAEFALLDKNDLRRGNDSPLTDGGASLVADAVPRVVGRVFVGQEIAVLESYDDGRLDGLADRLTTLAASSLAPAHPRTKILGKVSRLQLALMWEWLLPEGTDADNSRRLNREFGSRLIREVWPDTPLSFLKGRTPVQAAAAGDAVVPLRAALLVLENSREPWRTGFDFAPLRTRLKVPSEPPIDPGTVDVDALHLSRLILVPADKLPDEKLATFYRRARTAMIGDALEAAATALVNRPESLEKLGIESLSVYSDLASLTASRGRHAEALEWVKRGRQADPAAKRNAHAPQWDMLELRLRAEHEDPAQWVPELAVVLDRYQRNESATQVVMMNMIDMGLIQMVNHPDHPGEVLLDSRPLQALMAEYGPRVTTASGRLGVSATRPEIWTPGSETGGASGGLWTPGAPTGGPAPQPGQGPAGDKKIIITGR